MADPSNLDTPQKKPPKPAAGAPRWMVTYSDMVTLLLTFFVLLLSFAKTETSKYEAVLGSLRNALGGNIGTVKTLGRSIDDQFTVVDSANPPKPFPIEFLTSDGLLDKHEVNRESDDDRKRMTELLQSYELNDISSVVDINETVVTKFSDKIFFKFGSVEIQNINVNVFNSIVKMISENNYHLLIEGYAARSERSKDGKDAMVLSSERALAVSRYLVKRGVSPDRLTVLVYGDAHASKTKTLEKDAKVEFVMKKTDLLSNVKQ